MSRRRGATILLGIGVLLGIGAGLAIGWLAWPVSYFDTDLYDLRADYQDDYVVMVGALYALERDVDAARQALALLSDPEDAKSPEKIVVDVTERYIERGAAQGDIRYLVDLAQALGSVTPVMQPFLEGQQP